MSADLYRNRNAETYLRKIATSWPELPADPARETEPSHDPVKQEARRSSVDADQARRR